MNSLGERWRAAGGPLTAGMRVERDGIEYTVLVVADGPWTDGGTRTEVFVHEHSSHDGPSRWEDAATFTVADDPCTLGGMLGVLRAEYRAPDGYAMYSHTIAAWCFCVPGLDPVESYVGEADALVSALERVHRKHAAG